MLPTGDVLETVLEHLQHLCGTLALPVERTMERCSRRKPACLETYTNNNIELSLLAKVPRVFQVPTLRTGACRKTLPYAPRFQRHGISKP